MRGNCETMSAVKWKYWSRKMRYIAGIVFWLMMILQFAGCGGRAKVSYNHLIGDEDRREFEAIMGEDVSQADRACILEYIDAYRTGVYAQRYLEKGWKTNHIYAQLYDSSTVINCYQEQEFQDLNCRLAAYILFHSHLQMQADAFSEEIFSVNQWEKERFPAYLAERYQDFCILFGNLILDGTVEETVQKHWQKYGVGFSGQNIRLVTLWGAKGNEVINSHAGILFLRENGEKLYFFEKTAPMHPFRLTIFDSCDDVRNYLLNYTDEYEDMTVLFDAGSLF